jgi:hypothetical protein
MTVPFDPAQGPILIEAEVSGPTGRSSLQLLVDTAATMTVIDQTLLIAVGYDPAALPDRVSVAMGDGVTHPARRGAPGYRARVCTDGATPHPGRPLLRDARTR